MSQYKNLFFRNVCFKSNGRRLKGHCGVSRNKSLSLIDKLSGVLNIDLGTPLTSLNSTGYKIGFERGRKNFELVNHLGNVLVTISDKKIGVDANSDTLINYYLADVVSASDYYSFGMQMPGRSYNVSNSAYGFNGKRKDNEIYGEGNFYDYGMRGYDPRGGRFWGIDPLQVEYPMLTPYQYAGNNPIAGMDLDGREFDWFMFELAEKKLFGTTHLQKIREGFTERAVTTAKSIPTTVKQIWHDATSPSGMHYATFDPTGLYDGNAKKMQEEMKKPVQVAKAIVKDYGDLINKAAHGDDKAIGALGFEVVLFAMPEGEEAKMASMVPRGFKNAEEFAQVGKELAEALEKSGIKYENIGVTGSAVTGTSSKGGQWREEATVSLEKSDIDAFIVLKEDIPINGGAKRPEFIHPDKILKKYPALKEWSDKWSEILGREITPAVIKPKSTK